MKKLLEGLEKFQSGYFDEHRQLFEQLSHGQKPRILFITCSDSRIDPNLITQAEVGELFVIRNAGNIIPPYGATNGGEGASIEYAINALGIEQVIICGHSHCGAMKGLLKLQSLADEMPLVYNWLKQAEATRRLVKDNYKELEGEELIEVTVAENVLNQLSNLQSYPIIRSRLHQGKLSLHGWIFRIETGEILAYDPILHDFVAPHSKITHPEPEENLPPSRHLPNSHPFKISEDYIRTHADLKKATPTVNTVAKKNSSSTQKPGYTYLEPSQADRIYRGSRS
ncbi:MAG: carbonic anhydrase [Microcystis wesenbergii Mw_QC_S_20081001_S30D]|jgi:carbonic anhydrase|uniref:Carbonic anhydrase n=2 Tax=Microcystis wesenbergii TaxID=44823 RepID=A0A552LDN0_9CHRO|nr:carbonic anhydrase [Microcystis aeruginosa W11-03]NCR93078.1 carbonic anhydrase [Microcystis aeruginosa W11-06]TRU95597.1 MAG: carbonic anhydrase [Microcystis wesenbergii Mw_QC_B_20070930_S4D]TRU97703.1 MAG: carbonic anhydrase [Microcystis wesenbergii Mw_QC_S_20081001_S30D]TRU98826.1 MAG: carbonic anhydrase [Microcystis wesenbergii Mw_QC_S_20081001_S30]TRV08282.1 MAG: carbonic anhydrase [Microcystis wesenbergii Mw_MB_S_20031200_S109]TRV17905.1 MAG: carbonic anhydrase [Microcystis wesenberg